MNAVESLVRTGVFPRVCTHSHAVVTVASEVRIVCTTSTSFMSGTGLKKCSPRTWPGRRVAAASAVTLHDEVLVASSACGGQMASSRAKVSFLSDWFSVIASTTRSHAFSSSSRVAPVSRPSASSRAFWSIRALATRVSRFFLMPASPRSRSCWLASTAIVGKPAWTDTWAMPPPMRPQPTTPTDRMAMRRSPGGVGRDSGRRGSNACAGRRPASGGSIRCRRRPSRTRTRPAAPTR